MKIALYLLVAVALLAPSIALAAGPADTPAAYTFTADGGMRLTTGALGPVRIPIRCGSGTAQVKFIWLDSAGAVVKVAPKVQAGTAAFYPLVGDDVHILTFEFVTDGPDSLNMDLITAAKADVLW